MSIRVLTVLLAFFAVSLPEDSAIAASPAKTHRSKSDVNINAIGHRQIVHGPNFYSPEKERTCGKTQAQKMERSYRLLDDPAITQYIGRVAENLAKNSDSRFPITAAVIDSDSPVAFALPGGYQYVSRGLLVQLASEAELASVLARGIAHTALRSWTTLATKADVTDLGPAAAQHVRSLSPDDPYSQVVATQIASLRRQDELDADYFGLQYLYKAGYDPNAFIDFIPKAGKATSAMDDGGAVLLGSFPAAEVRLAAVREEISNILPPRADAIVTTPEFAAFKARLRPQDSESQR
jgi:beta-barrel assembly-enhancing protease